MLQQKLLLPMGALIFSIAFTSGCGQSKAPISTSAAPDGRVEPNSTHGSHEHDHGDHSHGSDVRAHAVANDPAVAAELAKLPTADREEAEMQQICPVSDEPLGSMGPPIKVAVQDRAVFICCEGCRTTLLEDANAYLAKLKN